MVARIQMTPAIAKAVGFDAANAQMQRAGRKSWNSDDANLAATTQAQLMQFCGSYHERLAADEVLFRNFPF